MENKIKPEWVITPYQVKDEKNKPQLKKFDNFQEILDFSEIYYIFGKYNGYRKLYTDFDIDPFKVTREQKSELGKSQNELKNNLEQNDKILRYLIVLTSIIAKIDKKIEYIHHDEVYFIRNIIYFIKYELTNKEIVTDKFNERLYELLDYRKFRNDLEVFYIFVLELLRLFVYLEGYEINQEINSFATVSDYLHDNSDFKTHFNNLQDQLQRNILEGKEVDAQRQRLVSVIEQSCIKFLEDVLDWDDLIFSLELLFIKTLYFNRLIDKKLIRKLKKNKKLKIFFDKLDEKFKSSEERNRKCFAILSEINQSDVKLFISGPKGYEQDFKGYIDKFINGELKIIKYLQYKDYSDDNHSPYILTNDKKRQMRDIEFNNIKKIFNEKYLLKLPGQLTEYSNAIYCTEKKVVSYIDKSGLSGNYELFVRYKRCFSCGLILGTAKQCSYEQTKIIVHDDEAGNYSNKGVSEGDMRVISPLMYLFKDFLDNHREKSDK